MRKFTLIALCLFINWVAYAQSSCYFPFEVGKQLSYEYYDGKDKLTSSSTYVVTDLTTDGDAQIATMNSKSYDKKGELLSEANFEASCSGDQLEINITDMMNPGMMASMSGFDISIDGTPYVIPNDLKVGNALPDGACTVQGGPQGMNVMKMTFNFTDRQVEAVEQLSTDAGTFECYKISYNLSFKMIVSKTYKIVEWYAKDVGLVRSETYNKKGKLESYQRLVSVE